MLPNLSSVQSTRSGLWAAPSPERTPTGVQGAFHQHEFASYESVFHAHFGEHRLCATGTYRDYRPVYRYGYDLGCDERYRTAEWPSVENVA